MNQVYLFVLILAGGYLGSRLIFTRIHLAKETQHLFLLGGEYILIGFLLGPSVLNVLSEPFIRDLSPILVVGIGWLGLLLGNQMAWRHLRRFPSSMYRVLLVENLLFIPGIILLFYMAAQIFPTAFSRLGRQGFWVLVAVLTATSSTALSLVSRAFHIPMRFTIVLRFVGSLEGLFGVLIIGMMDSLSHEPFTLLGESISGLEWLALALFLGGIGGVFSHLIFREAGNEFETVLIIMGIVIYAGGMAYYLNMSALFVAFVIGAVLANLSHNQERISQILAGTEKPFYIVFLIFAGALVRFQHWNLFLVAPVLFVLRALVKWLSTWGATRMVFPYRQEHWSMGLGLSSLEALALAMALEFELMHPGEGAHWFLGVVILMVLVNQVVTPVIFRQILPRLRSK